MSRTKLLLPCLLVLLVGATGVMAESHPDATWTNGVVLASGMQDVRVEELDMDHDADVLDYVIDSAPNKVNTKIKDWFNGKTNYPTMSNPTPEADTRPDVLTAEELEAGLHQWWQDRTPEQGTPSDQEREDFDRVYGQIVRQKLYTLANPVARQMLADDISAQTIYNALIYSPPQDSSIAYQGLIFGKAAREAEITYSLAHANMKRALEDAGIAGAYNKAETYLTTNYGDATWDFYIQKSPPGPGTGSVRGNYWGGKYERYEDMTVEDFQPFTSTNGLPKDQDVGTTQYIYFEEPFDPGASDSTVTSQLMETNCEIWAVLRGQVAETTEETRYRHVDDDNDPDTPMSDDDGVPGEDTKEAYTEEVTEDLPDVLAGDLAAKGTMYIENYRKVTSADLNFTGQVGGQTVQTTRLVGTSGQLHTPVVLPYTAEDGGTADLTLPDSAQVNSAFKAIAELGDGFNSYVKYSTTGLDVSRCTGGDAGDESATSSAWTLLYWVPPTLVPNGMTTRWNTRYRGPGLGPTSGEDPSIIERIVQEGDTEGLIDFEPPPGMRDWLDKLLFNECGNPRRPQEVNTLIKVAFGTMTDDTPDGKYSGLFDPDDPFDGHSPYAICNTDNGHIMKINLQFDINQGSQTSNTTIFEPGDVVLPQNYTQTSPLGLLYAAIDADAIPEDKMPKGVDGQTIPPNGENLYLEASTCCGITSIIGGSTVTKHDSSRPNGQITVLESSAEEDSSSFSHKVGITAGVPNDSRAGLDPVGEPNLIYPLSRIHKSEGDEGVPVLPEDGSDSGVQGQDARFYGNYCNNAEELVHAPDDATIGASGRPYSDLDEYGPTKWTNPVDGSNIPWMSMQGDPNPASQFHQKYYQGHRYNITIAAWDNLSDIAIAPGRLTAFPDGLVCYAVSELNYAVYKLDASGNRTKQFDGKVIPEPETQAALDAVANGEPYCVETAPSVELQWIPHADGPYVWEVEIRDLDGLRRVLVSQVNVIEENIESQRIDFDTQRGEE